MERGIGEDGMEDANGFAVNASIRVSMRKGNQMKGKCAGVIIYPCEEQAVVFNVSVKAIK